MGTRYESERASDFEYATSDRSYSKERKKNGTMGKLSCQQRLGGRRMGMEEQVMAACKDAQGACRDIHCRSPKLLEVEAFSVSLD